MAFKYLEDFLEFSEGLPTIYRERLTRIRELDLEVNNRRDNVKLLRETLGIVQREKSLRADPHFKMHDIAQLCREIAAELDRIVQLSVRKVVLVESLVEVTSRYNKHINEETEKFKLELEADNRGSTAKLETRAMEEMRMFKPDVAIVPIDADAARKKPVRQGVAHELPAALAQPRVSPNPTGRSRRTISFPTTLANDYVLANGETVVSDPPAHQLPDPTRENGVKTTSSVRHNSLAGLDDAELNRRLHVMDFPDDFSHILKASQACPLPRTDRDSAIPLTSEDEDEEASYCFCGGTESSGGDFMVACDNSACQIEWFHAECVGIKNAQDIQGKQWYCPVCRKDIKNQQDGRTATVPFLNGETRTRSRRLTGKTARLCPG